VKRTYAAAHPETGNDSSDLAKTWHLVVDLSNPGDSLAVIQLVDSLMPFDTGHLYHIFIDFSTVQKIRYELNVPCNMYPQRPRESTTVPGSPRSEAEEVSSKGWTTIYSQGFEGSWPARFNPASSYHHFFPLSDPVDRG
jgi:hypothetical protein